MPEDAIAYTKREAAAKVGSSERHITRLIAAGRLMARKDGRRTLVDASSVRAFYESLPAIEGPAPLFKKPGRS